jgi:hypothetical protein
MGCSAAANPDCRALAERAGRSEVVAATEFAGEIEGKHRPSCLGLADPRLRKLTSMAW